MSSNRHNEETLFRQHHHEQSTLPLREENRRQGSAGLPSLNTETTTTGQQEQTPTSNDDNNDNDTQQTINYNGLKWKVSVNNDTTNSSEFIHLQQQQDQQFSNENDGILNTINDNDDDDGNDEISVIIEEDEIRIELEHDVYSIIFLKNVGIVYFFAIFIVILQLTIICLFYWDLLQDSSPDNALNLPISVDINVKIAQFLAMPLAVMSHEDCTTALYLLRADYDDAILKDFPHATKFSWLLSLSMRFITGLLLIFISFVQIMQSTRITDLFLNLEAIVFVGNIDNFAFWLADKGFLKRDFQIACQLVKETSFAPSIGMKRTPLRRALLLGTWFILIVGWAIINIRQNRGQYLFDGACQSFTVQFGSNNNNNDIVENDYYLTLEIEYNPNNNGDDLLLQDTIRDYFINDRLFNNNNNNNSTDTATTKFKVDLVYSYFSGVYHLGYDLDTGRIEIINDRGVYYETIQNDNSFNDMPYHDAASGKFYYCENDNNDKNDNDPGVWVFTIDALAEHIDRRVQGEDCPGWLLRSPPTEAFFLHEVPLDGWRIWNTIDRESSTQHVVSTMIIDSFQLDCNDCKKVVDCNYHGTCNTESSQCECDDNYSGTNCEKLSLPFCTTIHGISTGSSSSDYTTLPDYTLLQTNGEVIIMNNDNDDDDKSNNNPTNLSMSLNHDNENYFLVQAHGRPVYVEMDAYLNAYNNITMNSSNAKATTLSSSSSLPMFQVLLYTGTRWFLSQWDIETFTKLFLIPQDQQGTMFSIDDDDFRYLKIHAFWDELFHVGIPLAISKPTTANTPNIMSISWEQIRQSQSRGRFYGPFTARDEIDSLSFECTNTRTTTNNNNKYNACQKDLKHCGRFGTCTINGTCECNSCFGGPFCEYSPLEDYARKEFETWLNSVQQDNNNNNMTTADEFVIMSEYYQLYWQNQDPLQCYQELLMEKND